ncbi:uncharacterized protein LOC135110395 [Scylla paramamosain]|uniref:uncharacterized protein LOC135110395 n=1 Tax=Scylla paramamosain TaxID=85552 RepID=UPI003082F21A
MTEDQFVPANGLDILESHLLHHVHQQHKESKKVARLRKEMEYHDSLAEAEAMFSKKKKERDLAVASAELNALSLVEEEVKMLPGNDESVEKQSYLQQYIESQNEMKAQAIANQQSDNAMPHKYVTFHDPQKPSCNRDNELMTNEVDGQIFSEPQVINLNPTAQSLVPSSRRHTHNVNMPNNVNNVRQNHQSFSYPGRTFAINIPDPKWSLPPIEPNTFDGEPMEFPSWLKNFETYVESKTSVGKERLAYLERYTTGEAKDAIKMLMHFNSDADYVQAKKILSDRFGNKSIIADAYTNKLMNWLPISPHNGPALTAFSDFLKCCLAAMKHTSYLSFLNDPREQRKVLAKLPGHVVHDWRKQAMIYLDTNSNNTSSSNEEHHPPFEMLCEFVQKEAKGASNPFLSWNSVSKEVNDWIKTQTRATNWKPRESNIMTKNRGSRTFMAKSIEEKPMWSFQSKVNVQANKQYPKDQESKGRFCHYCTKDHDLDDCKEFAKLDGNTRYKFAKEKRLCTGCLKMGHKGKDCRRRKVCKVCQRYHPTALHNDDMTRTESQRVPAQATQPKDDKPTVVANKVKVTESVTHDMHTMIVPVWLHHVSNEENKFLVYSLLDEQSDASFIKESTLNKLGVSGPSVSLNIHTISGKQITDSIKIHGLKVRGYNEEVEISIPSAYSTENISAGRSQIPRTETACDWPHLKAISDKLMKYDPNNDIGLLIGLDCAEAIMAEEQIAGDSKKHPYARRTELGWGIIGKISPHSSPMEDTVVVYRTVTQEVEINEEKRVNFLVVPTKTKEMINPSQVRDMFELDFSDRKSADTPLSYEDKRFMSKMKEGVHQLKDGHYELPLPLKDDNVKLPNNKLLAEQRLKKLRAKLEKDNQHEGDYKVFMDDMITKGYAEVVPTKDLVRNDGKVWYIPHHGVYHPRKPRKLRVVFDCSANYRNQSLNSHLLQGPDLTNKLIGVLCRFRQESIALVCDIEAMYHQVKVNPEHRDMLRFLWWENGDLNNKIAEYRMTAHLFGATSSPSVANFALKKAADDYGCGFDAAKFVRNNFYVDDGLKSVATMDEGVTLIQQSKELCYKGGFNLHKFLSNNKAVLAAISPHERADGIKSLDFSKNEDTLPIERTLGVEWCIESDTFQFRIKLKDKPLTRRGILSTVSSIYDPLGLVSPLILTGKQILQELCKNAVDWDDEVPDYVKPKWIKWKDELHKLDQLKVPRCYKPDDFGEVEKVELHHFSDACQEGYGQCSYIRLISKTGQIHCALVMAKSRVTPLKTMTIPRLELAAAVVSVRIHKLLKGELEYNNVEEVFWTDSKVVLGYIANEAKRFHVYVANRVETIRDHTSPNQWKFVETQYNPADHASRGMTADELCNSKIWWNGPEFLWQHSKMDSHSKYKVISENDPEVKKVVCHAVGTQQPTDILERLEYFSDWFKAKRAVAVCLKLLNSFRGKGDGTTKVKGNTYKPVNVAEVSEAENVIIKQLQAKAFQKEINVLKSSANHNSLIKGDNGKGTKVIDKTSSLYNLDPFIDKNGIMRVGGRLRFSNLTDESKHPVILPKTSHITQLIICHHHKRTNHQGRGITLNEIRSCGYWIVGGSSLVSRHISKCIICRKVRSTTQGQKMADLPIDRLEPSPPFTYSAVDFFGPFYVKEGRKELKRYGVLFTCMACRAVHIETANSMDTSSFLSAYRHFVGRRGPVRQLRCDQGTNFVGAKSEYEKCLKELK